MMRDLSRLLRPKSIALFGGDWAANVVAQLQKSGYSGAILPVHPTRAAIHGIRCFRDVADLPATPDAAFVGVNREATVEIVRRLAEAGAGGAVCFASGFLESEAEGTGGAELQARLVAAAGAMPILGPNCYGLINYLDNVTLWPDQHGGRPVERGVAIVAQSSNIAINMTMQRRNLPLAYVLTAGNQAQTGLAEIASALVADPRVTALGLYIEGFGDIRAFEAMAAQARAAGKPVVALKAGRSAQAQAGALTHTASLAGGSAAASAFLARLGIVEVPSIAAFLETLKLLHFGGPLAGPAVVSVSCSGGEASLMADLAVGTRLRYRPFGDRQRAALGAVLGPIVTVANPLDYHTFIWGDVARMTDCFAAAMADGFDLATFVFDIPRADRCDPSAYAPGIAAILAARSRTGARVAVLASLPENLDEATGERLAAAGITPLHGMADGVAAINAAIRAGELARLPLAPPVLLAPAAPASPRTLTEAEAKAALAGFGLSLPRAVTAGTPEELVAAAEALCYPLALKGLGVAHKSEAGAVALDIDGPEALRAAAAGMLGAAEGFLAEEMVAGTIVELLVGVTRDPTGLVQLTLGAGGVLAELLRDTATLLLPASRADIRDALASLRVAALLAGFRGGAAADLEAALDAAEAIIRFADANAGRLVELDVNPLMVGPRGAVAADALIRISEDQPDGAHALSKKKKIEARTSY
jgi:acyl-CoA synthetase (NDP forming)